MSVSLVPQANSSCKFPLFGCGWRVLGKTKHVELDGILLHLLLMTHKYKIHLHPCIWQVLRTYGYEMWLCSKYILCWGCITTVLNAASVPLQHKLSHSHRGGDTFFCLAHLPSTLAIVYCCPREQGWEYTTVSHPNTALPHTLRLLTSPGTQILTFLSTSILTSSGVYTHTQ